MCWALVHRKGCNAWQESYHAVRKGTVTGIFRTWEECKKNVHGYSGAEYKSFKTLEEAEAYMKGGAAAEEVTHTVPHLCRWKL